MKSLAPIVLFTYNRPNHTKQVLDALAQNIEAKDSLLYIFCDGAKENGDIATIAKIEDVQTICKNENRFKEVIVRIQEKNLGLANSVITGVSEVVNKHGKVIVLEDDIVVGKNFLRFLNKGLDFYKENENVYGISGYCFPYEGTICNDTFFLPLMSSWGYGTWKSSWNKINFEANELLQIVDEKKIGTRLNFGNLFFYKMLHDQVDGKIDSWAIRFYVSMYLNKGVFLYPNKSLLQNIGFDGSGVHCGADKNRGSSFFDDSISCDIVIQKVKLEKSILKKFNNNRTQTFQLKGLKMKVKSLLAPELIQFIKRKLNKPIYEFGINLHDVPRYTPIQINFKGKDLIVADSASFRFMYKEIFVEEIYKFSSSSTQPVIIDGGANIGLATIYFKTLYPDSKVLCFEPDKSIFKLLKRNLEAFKFNDVSLFEKGLWDKDMQLSFNSEGADGGVISSLAGKDQTFQKKQHLIEVVSLKTILKGYTVVDFLKLDIEGAETIVLKNIVQDLNKIERIFIEYHSFVRQEQTLNEIILILKEANFRLHISSPGLISKSPFTKLNIYNNMDMQLNIYAFKENS